MKVTVSRGGVAIGVWDRADLKAAVASGELQPTDRYFASGMASWLPLSSLTNGLSLPKKEKGSTTLLSPASYWRRAATSAGGALIVMAVVGALIYPNYFAQGLMAAAGILLIAAARTLA